MSKPKLKIEAAVVVSDLHVWSTVGLWPAGFFKTLAGTYVGQNDFQKWLWECWLDLWQNRVREALGKAPYLLVVNGDICEGRHNRTDQLMTGSDDDQLSAFEEVMKPALTGVARVIVTKGTECHTRNLENHAARIMGAIPDPNTGHYAWDKAMFEINGTRCIARHHVPCATRPWAESAGMRAVLLSEQLEAFKNGEPVPKVVLGAHRHVYGEDRSNHGLCAITPAWQGLTRFGYKVVAHNHACNPGALILNFRDRKGETPTSELLVFKPRPIQAVSIC